MGCQWEGGCADLRWLLEWGVSGKVGVHWCDLFFTLALCLDQIFKAARA